MTLHDPFVNNYIHNTHSLSIKCNTNIVLHLKVAVFMQICTYSCPSSVIPKEKVMSAKTLITYLNADSQLIFLLNFYARIHCIKLK